MDLLKFIPEQLRETAEGYTTLYTKIVEILQAALNGDITDIRELEEHVDEIWKYWAILDKPENAPKVRPLIDPFNISGISQISDNVLLSRFLYYLPGIYQSKGTMKAFDLAIKLAGFDADIIPWYDPMYSAYIPGDPTPCTAVLRIVLPPGSRPDAAAEVLFGQLASLLLDVCLQFVWFYEKGFIDVIEVEEITKETIIQYFCDWWNVYVAIALRANSNGEGPYTVYGPLNWAFTGVGKEAETCAQEFDCYPKYQLSLHDATIFHDYTDNHADESGIPFERAYINISNNQCETQVLTWFHDNVPLHNGGIDHYYFFKRCSYTCTNVYSYHDATYDHDGSITHRYTDCDSLFDVCNLNQGDWYYIYDGATLYDGSHDYGGYSSYECDRHQAWRLFSSCEQLCFSWWPLAIYDGTYIYGAPDIPAHFSGEPTTYNLFDPDPMAVFIRESISELVPVDDRLSASYNEEIVDTFDMSEITEVLRRYIVEDFLHNGILTHDGSQEHQGDIIFEVS